MPEVTFPSRIMAQVDKITASSFLEQLENLFLGPAENLAPPDPYELRLQGLQFAFDRSESW